MIEKRVNFEGQNIIIRTVTYHYVGRCILHNDEWLVLEDAGWVADSGRWNHALTTGDLSEFEPYPDKVFVTRASVVDVTQWDHELPREVR